MNEQGSSKPSWGWLVAGAAVLTLGILVAFDKSGTCRDYALPVVEGPCEIGKPDFTEWTLGAASALFFSYAVYRTFRKGR